MHDVSLVGPSKNRENTAHVFAVPYLLVVSPPERKKNAPISSPLLLSRLHVTRMIRVSSSDLVGERMLSELGRSGPWFQIMYFLNVRLMLEKFFLF